MVVKQPNLFASPNAYAPNSPTLPEAIQARDEAIGAAQVKAEAQDEGFIDRAKKFILIYLEKHGPTPGEDITDACVKAGIIPDELRAFGPAYMGLVRAKKIVKHGYCKRRRGHGTSGGNIWRLA